MYNLIINELTVTKSESQSHHPSSFRERFMIYLIFMFV